MSKQTLTNTTSCNCKYHYGGDQKHKYIPFLPQTTFSIDPQAKLPENTGRDFKYSEQMLLTLDKSRHVPFDWCISSVSGDRDRVSLILEDVMSCLSTQSGIPMSVMLLRTDSNGRTPLEAIAINIYKRYVYQVETNPNISKCEKGRILYWSEIQAQIIRFVGLWAAEVSGRIYESKTCIIHEGFARQVRSVMFLLWRDGLIPAVIAKDEIAQNAIRYVFETLVSSEFDLYSRFYKGDKKIAEMIEILLQNIHQINKDTNAEEITNCLQKIVKEPPELTKEGVASSSTSKEPNGDNSITHLDFCKTVSLLKLLPLSIVECLFAATNCSSFPKSKFLVKFSLSNTIKHKIVFFTFDRGDEYAYNFLKEKMSNKFRDSCDCDYDFLCSRAFALLNAGCSPSCVAKLCLEECKTKTRKKSQVCGTFEPSSIILSLCLSIVEAFVFLPGPANIDRTQSFSFEHILDLRTCNTKKIKKIACKKQQSSVQANETVKTGEIYYWWIMDCARAVCILLSSRMEGYIKKNNIPEVTKAAKVVFESLCHVATKPIVRAAYYSLLTSVKDLNE